MMSFEFKPTFMATVCTVIGVSVLLGLGTWQAQRLAWKNDLLQTIEMRMKEDILIFPRDILNAEKFDYTKGAVRGVFLHEYEFYVQPRKYKGRQGVHVLTPFRRLSGDIILVNRGFARMEDLSFMRRPKERMILNGILHGPDDRNRFTPLNESGSRTLYATDVDFIEQETGLKFATPLVLYASEVDSGVPVGGQLNMNIPNNHLEYMFFWYLMALMMMMFYVTYSLKRKPAPKKRSGKRPG